jgi:hypothetical protein
MSIRTKIMPSARDILDVIIATVAGAVAVCVLFPIYLLAKLAKIIIRRSGETPASDACRADS